MKKLLFTAFLLIFSLPLFCQETSQKTIDGGKFNFTFDEGVAYAQVTRVETQTERSNFVRENMMIGAYCNFETVDFSSIDFFQQLSAYYPFYNAFNGMRQYPKNMFNYGIDSYTGLKTHYTKFEYFTFDMGLGLHYMFQMTDEWPMHYLGLGIQAGLNLPLTETISIATTGFVSFDNANIGSNKLMQPFEISYQYHATLGVKYSKRAKNSYCYIKPKSL